MRNIRYKSAAPSTITTLPSILFVFQLFVFQHDCRILVSCYILPLLLILLFVLLLLFYGLCFLVLLLPLSRIQVEICRRQRLLLRNIYELVEKLLDVFSRFGRNLEIWEA